MTAAADPVQLPIRGMTCAALQHASKSAQPLARRAGAGEFRHHRNRALTFNNDASSVLDSIKRDSQCRL